MFAPKPEQFQLPYRVPLTTIDEIVSARLGTTRVSGNAQPAVFNRQVAMYLAKHVGGWSTTRIGKFYNGRDHSTVCHALKRIEALREADPDNDALITNLTDEIRSARVRSSTVVGLPHGIPAWAGSRARSTRRSLDALADRIVEKFRARTAEVGTSVAVSEMQVSAPTVASH